MPAKEKILMFFTNSSGLLLLPLFSFVWRGDEVGLAAVSFIGSLVVFLMNRALLLELRGSALQDVHKLFACITAGCVLGNLYAVHVLPMFSRLWEMALIGLVIALFNFLLCFRYKQVKERA
jgi:hypothetical protein